MTDVLAMFWDNLPAICFGAFGTQLALLVAGLLRDRRRTEWPPRGDR